MRLIRFGIILLCLYVLIATTIGINNPVAADSPSTPKVCSLLTADTLTALQKACSTNGINSACYGNDTASITAGTDAASTFAKPGDQVDLTKVTTINTVAATDASKFGIALMHIQSDLPADSQGISAVLFGTATMQSKVKTGGADLSTLNVQTIDVDPVLLRTGASSNNPAAAKLFAGKTALADGRLQDASWIRVRVDGAIGWALASQLKVNGDPNSLTVLDANDIDMSFLYKAPMQAFSLTTGTPADSCSTAPSGLLLQLGVGKTTAATATASSTTTSTTITTHLLVNGVDIALTAPASALLRATPKDRFEIIALDGTVTIAAQGASLDLNPGEWTRLRIGGKDGLTLTQPPNAKSQVPFSTILGTPVTLLSDPLPCSVGLSAKDASITIHDGPDTGYSTVTYMKPDSTYTVAGYAQDSNGGRWWKLNADNGTEAWVDSTAVYSLGACDAVAKVDTSGAVVSNTSTGGSSNGGSTSSSGPATAAAAGISYAPTARTIWAAHPTLDKLVGQCSGGPINYCDQMIAVTPNGTGFLWKGQALKQFPMFPAPKVNVYSYSGVNGTDDGKVSMVMVFTGPTSMVMTETETFNSEPSCKHVHTFTATFLR